MCSILYALCKVLSGTHTKNYIWNESRINEDIHCHAAGAVADQVYRNSRCFRR